MATLNHCIYEIKMLLTKNRLADDSRFDGRLVENEGNGLAYPLDY